jgi:O-antigen/teichoic acid export membrane protein
VSAAPEAGLPGRPGLARRLVRGGAWALLGRSLGLPAGLTTAVLLARLLSPAEVGGYFLAMSLITIAAFFAQLGMARPVVKLVASALATGRPEAARHTIRVALLTTLAGGAVLALLIADGPGMWLASMLRDGDLLGRVLPLVALLVVAYALVDLMAESLRGFHDLRAASFLGDGLAQRLLLAVVLATLWASAAPLDLATVLELSLVNSALVLLLAGAVLGLRLKALPRHGARFRTREILEHGPPFLAVRLNVWLLAGADLWILGIFRSAEEVAIYGVASRMALLVGIPLLVVNATLAPAIAELYSRGERARLQAALRAAATLSTIVSIAVLAVFALLGQALLEVAFGPAYAGSFVILVVLGLGQLVNVACGSCTLALTMTGHQRDVLVIATLAAALTFAALFLVAPAFGAPGVAAVIATSLALYNVALALAVRRRLGLTSWAAADRLHLAGLLRDLRQAARFSA